MNIKLKIKIKQHNKIRSILNNYGYNILCSGLDNFNFYIYSIDRDIHIPISSAIVGELKDWKYIIQKSINCEDFTNGKLLTHKYCN